MLNLNVTAQVAIDADELVGQFSSKEMTELIRALSVSDLIRDIGADTLLDEIGEDVAREHFGIKESAE